jgi:pilus assembly protein FimV
MARKLAAVVFSLGYGIQASSVMALGLGELKLESFLNEPLKASVDLLNTVGLHEDEIKIRLATREDFQKLGLDRAYFLTKITFEVELDDKGRAQIIMSSDDPVLEPYLDFIVEARWPSGRLLREYTVLIDPPVFGETVSPSVSASQRVEEVEGIPAPAKKKDEAAATSGTRVGVKKKSDLPPGTMPQRDFSATTASTPTAGSRYMISRDQTLWEIASLARPEGASIHQTMLDIQRLNPQAFINGNINRVKAGYIVYLPSADDISSGNLSAALAEVNEQNAAWRAGRDAELVASSRPSLKISAESDDSEDSTGQDSSMGEAGGAMPDSSVGAGADDIDGNLADSGDTAGRMAAMQQQLETMQRIVNLKDEQIAALQSELAESGSTEGEDALAAELAGELAQSELTEDAEALTEEPDESIEDIFADLDESDEELIEEETVAEETVYEETVAEEAATAAAAVKPSDSTSKPPAQAESSGGIMDYIFYILGAVVLAIVGFIFARRRGADSDEQSMPVSSPAAEDLFSEVELQEEQLEIESPEEDYEEDDGEVTTPESGNRGYGERKHDEYASDVEAADALAEADIYIAYGRHPQAVDLLTNALANEPGNPVYRVKLIEIHTELNDRGAAAAQFEQLQSSGDAESIARAEALMAGMDKPVAVDLPEGQDDLDDAPRDGDAPGLAPNPLELVTESGESLEADFSDLEIEGGDEADELDLTSDFEDSEDDDYDDEDLVIADDANGLSTKMDLARAYLDMGDDDGARQILDEVVAEGSEELKAEALELLERIG